MDAVEVGVRASANLLLDVLAGLGSTPKYLPNAIMLSE
jgi:hypothetical protein